MSRKRSQKEIAAWKAKERSGSARTPRRTAQPRSSSSSTPVVKQSNGPYKHNGYILHTREVTLRPGRTQRIYFFCKAGNKPKSGVPCDKPDNMVVGVNKRTGLPYLKKGN